MATRVCITPEAEATIRSLWAQDASKSRICIALNKSFAWLDAAVKVLGLPARESTWRKPKPALITRECNCCLRMFKTDSAFIRTCDECKNQGRKSKKSRATEAGAVETLRQHHGNAVPPGDAATWGAIITGLSIEGAAFHG